jgi:hypothetical protein
MLPDLERAERIGEFEAIRGAATFVELIEGEEDRTLRAVLVGMLREGTEPRPLIGRMRTVYPIRSTSPLASWPRACH